MGGLSLPQIEVRREEGGGASDDSQMADDIRSLTEGLLEGGEGEEARVVDVEGDQVPLADHRLRSAGHALHLTLISAGRTVCVMECS